MSTENQDHIQAPEYFPKLGEMEYGDCSMALWDEALAIELAETRCRTGGVRWVYRHFRP